LREILAVGFGGKYKIWKDYLVIVKARVLILTNVGKVDLVGNML
jgi:hypothetical protein